METIVTDPTTAARQTYKAAVAALDTADAALTHANRAAHDAVYAPAAERDLALAALALADAAYEATVAALDTADAAYDAARQVAVTQ